MVLGGTREQFSRLKSHFEVTQRCRKRFVAYCRAGRRPCDNEVIEFALCLLDGLANIAYTTATQPYVPRIAPACQGTTSNAHKRIEAIVQCHDFLALT